MKIELHVPGLFAVPGRHVDALQLPDLQVLRDWNTQADTKTVASGRYGFVCERLGVPRPPLAALAWLGAFGYAAECQTFLATPVHLQAGMRDVVLFAGGGLEITDTELAAIAHDANQHFDSDPALTAADGQLFLQSPQPLDVRTVPLHWVQGATMRQHLPDGSDASRLNSWVNELQMFLHSHAINRSRAAQGKPQLNGIWVWGEGKPPAVQPLSDATMHAGSSYMRGVGVLLGASVTEPVSIDHLRGEGMHIVEFDGCVRALDADDMAGWQKAVEDAARYWLQPVLDRVRRGECAEAVLYGGDGLARRVSGNRRWWRRLLSWRGGARPQLLKEE